MIHDHADCIFGRSPVDRQEYAQVESIIGNTIGTTTSLITADLYLNLYIPVYHTNWQSVKNMIDAVVNRLVGTIGPRYHYHQRCVRSRKKLTLEPYETSHTSISCHNST